MKEIIMKYKWYIIGCICVLVALFTVSVKVPAEHFDPVVHGEFAEPKSAKFDVPLWRLLVHYTNPMYAIKPCVFGVDGVERCAV